MASEATALPCLVFELHQLRLGLPVGAVQEVVRAVSIALLPKAPPVVEGAINLRGAIVPVLDLRRRFELPPRRLSPDQHFVIARTLRRLVALRVDRARELVHVPAAAIVPTPMAIPGAEHVAGVAALEDGLLVIYDLDTFLSLDEVGQTEAAVLGLMADSGEAASSPADQARL
jgi:purine-binding chemotaxis protein CheW